MSDKVLAVDKKDFPELQEVSRELFSLLQEKMKVNSTQILNSKELLIQAIEAWSYVHGLSTLLLDGQLLSLLEESKSSMDALIENIFQ